MFIRPKIIADLFTNLAAGWFGLILIIDYITFWWYIEFVDYRVSLSNL